MMASSAYSGFVLGRGLLSAVCLMGLNCPTALVSGRRCTRPTRCFHPCQREVLVTALLSRLLERPRSFVVSFRSGLETLTVVIGIVLQIV